MNIIITGASSGVGFEAVLDLIVKQKHKVVALARSEDKLERLFEIAKGLNPDCELYPACFDIAHDNYQQDLIPFIKRNLGQVDVLINNAGVLINKPFMELTQIDFASMLQANLLGHVKIIQQVVPLMPAGAHILNIGSMGGFHGSDKFPGLSAYSASKGALHTLTECLAVELADREIKVNALALGSAQTEMFEEAFPDAQSPVSAFEMGAYIAQFAVTGQKFYNGKVLPVATSTP